MLLGPAVGELIDAAALDLLRQAFVGVTSGLAQHGIGDPRTGADQHQARDPLWNRQRQMQGDPPSHRVTDHRERGRRERGDVPEHGSQIDGHGVGGAPVTAEVGRQRPVAFSQLRGHAIPAGAGLREAVEQDQ